MRRGQVDAAQTHDRALAELFFDLRNSQIDGPCFFRSFVRHCFLPFLFTLLSPLESLRTARDAVLRGSVR